MSAPRSAVVRQAASVMVLRTVPSSARRCSNHEFEVLWMKRSATSKFMPSRYVWPGGALEKHDSVLAAQVLKFCGPQRDLGLGFQEDAAYRVGALRELYEETGLMLARSVSQPLPAAGLPARAEMLAGQGIGTAESRSAVAKDATAFGSLCASCGVLPDVAALKTWARWITPRAEPRARFDTWFFVTALCPDSSAGLAHVGADADGEAEKVEWMCPCAALAAQEEGRLLLAPPQVYVMEELRSARTADQVLRMAEPRPGWPQPTQPTLLADPDQVVVALPGDPLHELQDWVGDGAPPRVVGKHRVVMPLADGHPKKGRWHTEVDGGRTVSRL